MLAFNGQMAASEIAHGFALSPPAISQHLKILRDAGLVRMESKAQQRLYALNPAALDEVEQWCRSLRAMWEQRFDTLDKLLQEQHAQEMDGWKR